MIYNGCAQFFHEIRFMIDYQSEKQNTFIREISGKSDGAKCILFLKGFSKTPTIIQLVI